MEVKPMLNLDADLTSHHIEGYAHQAKPGEDHFRCPLVTHITGNLWVGGCIDGLKLPDDFRYVVSLYPWEKYRLGPNTDRVEYRLFDSGDLPDADTLREIAAVAAQWVGQGKTLIHCQAGLNRSNLIAALVLTMGGMAAADAIALLREKRSPVVLCNQAFENWLLSHA